MEDGLTMPMCDIKAELNSQGCKVVEKDYGLAFKWPGFGLAVRVDAYTSADKAHRDAIWHGRERLKREAARGS